MIHYVGSCMNFIFLIFTLSLENTVSCYSACRFMFHQIPRNGDDPHPSYPGCKLRTREYVGRTRKSREDFMEWLVNVKYGEYRY